MSHNHHFVRKKSHNHHFVRKSLFYVTGHIKKKKSHLTIQPSVCPSIRPYFYFLVFFTKLGMCFDIVEVWFGIANGQISSIFDRVIGPQHVWFSFTDDNCVNINGFSPNLVCTLILWRSGLGLLMGKVRQFLTELSAHDTSDFSFLDNNLSKSQWIFTKLYMCIDIVEI